MIPLSQSTRALELLHEVLPVHIDERPLNLYSLNFYSLNPIKMQASKGYLLKRGNQAIGLSERRGDMTLHYVMSFSSMQMARAAHYMIHPNPVLRIERGRDHDVTGDLEDAIGRGLTSRVIINTTSRLYLPKMPPLKGGALHPLNDGGFHLQVLPMEDVYMMPFERNIGVLLPYDLVHENVREMVYDCHVIDPCCDRGLFKASLS